MNQRPGTKLHLNRETLRLLTESEQSGVQGGKVAPVPSANGSCKDTCKLCPPPKTE